MPLSTRHLRPQLAPLLAQEELQAIHLAALQVLEEVGIAARHPGLRGLLAGRQGLSFREGRLHLAPSLVQSHVDAYRAERLAQPAPPPGDAITLGTSCCAHYVVDLETDAVRPAVWQDAVQAIQLAEAMHDEGVTSSVPVVPQDVPPQMQALAEFLLSARYCRGGGQFVAPCSLEGLEYIYRMHQALGQPFDLPLFIVSPLQIDGDSLEAVLHFLGRAQSLSASSMPIRGVSAPIHLVGGFVQSLAESLAGLVILKEIAPGAPVSFGLDSFAFDMRETSISYGSPEMNLADMLKREIAAYYGMGHASTRSIRSMAKRPGVQAVAEKAASAMAGALAGSRHFFGGGQLAVDEVFSLEQLAIDREITDYAQHLVQGCDVGPDELSIEIIRQAVAAGGDFLGHPSTAASHRRAFWSPRLFEHSMVKAWQERGEPEARAAARARVRQRLAAYRGGLPAGKDAELTALYQEAWRKLAGAR